MNYLAHLALSKRQPELMIGNFIADDIPLKEESQLPDAVMLGIKLHRKIDAFTDSTSSFKEAVVKLRTHHGKYASVVIDILNDHLLSKNWDLFFDEREDDFHSFVYHSFDSYSEDLPFKAQRHIDSLLSYRYLRAYGSKEGLLDVLGRMDKRTRFPSDFKSSLEHLYKDYDFYNELFLSLFKDLLKLVDAN